MKKTVDIPFPRVRLMAAMRAQEPILANLLELYAHDFSEFHKLEVGMDGRFGYDSLPLYWSETGRYPFLVSVDGQWAGLALVKKGSEISGNENVWDMAEFFVLRGYRRRGIATRIACDVWAQYPGSWEVRVMRSNLSAFLFWAHAIATFVGSEVAPVEMQRGTDMWVIFSFESKAFK